MNTITWLTSPDHAWYTAPRRHLIEYLPNGKYRYFDYRCGLSSLHATFDSAEREARRHEATA
jgi:hypothetical protein